MAQLDNAHMIAILAYDGVQLSAVLGLQDMFSIADRNVRNDDGPRLIAEIIDDAETCKHRPGEFVAAILPPNISGARGAGDIGVHNWLHRHHQAGTAICSVCAGAFWLGHAGFLHGRPATTHWALEQEFRETFPDVPLDVGQLLIDDNDIVTAGGLMAWLDLGLYIVNRWLGPHVVSTTARQLLVDPAGREQRNYRSFRPVLTHGDERVLSLQHWMEANVANDITVDDMARHCRMSRRTFLRRFKTATGIAPSTYLQNLRMEKARGLLERTRLPIGEIGWRVGYPDASAFARVFREMSGLTAGAYRKRFGILTVSANARGEVREQ